MKLGIVILAAGQGTRMRSRLPKVLHELAGKPLLGHVLDTARSLKPEKIVVVYGHGGEQVRAAFAAQEIEWVEQSEQLGTGHAVQMALPRFNDVDKLLVLYGDVPLLRSESLARLIRNTTSGLGLMTMELPDPTGYGRIQRGIDGHVLGIVEQKDASPEQLVIREVNTGIMLFEPDLLIHWLRALSPENAQGEYYLTDVVAMAVEQGVGISVSQPEAPVEAAGVNDRRQLASLERVYQQWSADELMLSGVTLKDPARLDVRGEVVTGMDVSIDINVVLEGKVILGNDVSIGANTLLRNVVIDDGVCIKENCIIEEAHVGRGSRVGPFARIRPGTDLRGQAHIGNFVEIKNSSIGFGSKVNHLSYIGDTRMGEQVNIGAGTITCNYDGAYKHQTQIGDRAFVGSNSALVAPVSVGSGATIGAGSVINKDAPEDQLSLSRSKQVTISGWKRPVKE